MSYEHPAFSGPFSPEGLQMVRPIEGLDDITPEWAWGGSTGKGVKVAIIDSGIDATHPGVGGPVNGYISVGAGPDGPIYDTEPHTDPYSHGTACAAIIRSFAPECELYSVKVIGADLIGRGKIFAYGLLWAIENGMHVCNMSLGTTKKDFFSVLHELADRAYFRNVKLVTAANNMPVPSFPSVYSSVISVASHDIQDPYRFYYNPNPPVEFGALGVNVRVAWLHGGWMTATGNSYATPHITGIVTKILGKHPDLTVFQIKSILRALAANVSRDAQPAQTDVSHTES
jgi:subtilisin family serine protease